MTAPATVAPADLSDAPMRAAIARYGHGVLKEWKDALDAIDARRRGYVTEHERAELDALADHLRYAVGAFERAMTEPPADLATRRPEDLRWFDLSGEIARCEQDGWAVWARVKRDASVELATGQAAGAAVAGFDGTPWERAQFIAIREALADGLQPRNGLEWLMLDAMTQALTLHRRWLAQHVTTSSLSAKAIDRDAERRGEWTPPRLAETETVDRAAQHADRAMRTFLRLLKSYRDGRKLIGTLNVLGGQVNVGEQQVISTRTARSTPRRTSPRTSKRKEQA
jgi:hypothetical protein